MRIFLHTPSTDCVSGRTGMHLHPFWHIDSFKSNDKATIKFIDRKFSLKDGDAILIPAHVKHNVIVPLGSKVCSVKFEPDQDSEGLTDKPILISGKKHGELLKLLFANDLRNKEIVSHYVSALLLTLKEKSFKKHGTEKQLDSRIQESICFIEANIFEDLSLDLLAANVNMSNSNFSKLFKNETGMSPMKKRRSLIIEKAAEMLECSDYNISEIGNALNFKDPQTFSRFFRKEVGIAPKSYRKRNIGQ